MISAEQLYAALKEAAGHMHCGLYADHNTFEAAQQRVFAVLKKFEREFEPAPSGEPK